MSTYLDRAAAAPLHRSATAWNETPPPLPAPPPWVDQAICAQTDPDAFYPDRGGSPRAAKKICLTCPVRENCLEYALEHQERFGIWGGYSERERRRMLNTRKAGATA